MSRHSSPIPEPKANRPFLIYLALLLTTVLVYSAVGQFQFVNLDDDTNITAKPIVRRGITAEGVAWAFTSGGEEYWIPLTKLSRLLDCEFFGINAGTHHLMNVLFHALATLMLFAFLNRATQARWPSALVAFLFALHPLHVESVAWITERKDVLCGLFWFAALWAYVYYAERPRPVRYVMVLVSFCFSIMSKPIAVAFPLVLLLVDVWPLRRTPLAKWTAPDVNSIFPSQPWGRVLLEKAPFFAIAAAAGVATYYFQSIAGAVQSETQFSFWLRFQNALNSYVIYLVKVFWPTSLAVFYPFPHDLPLWQAGLAGCVMVAVSFVCLRHFRSAPYLAVGWFWYVITLAPVIGIVQAGLQARADRYTYLPLTGLFIMVAWSVADLIARRPEAKRKVVASLATACLACVVVTTFQLAYWRDSESLWRRAIDVTDANYVAHYLLGSYLLGLPNRLPDAIAELQRSVQIKSDEPGSHSVLGAALAKVPGRSDQAIAEFRQALKLRPNDALTHNALGLALAERGGHIPEAVEEYETALRLKPDLLEAHASLASLLFSIPGRTDDVISHYEAMLRLDPNLPEVHYNLAGALASKPGRVPDAIAHLQAALRLRPDFQDARRYLQQLTPNQAGQDTRR